MVSRHRTEKLLSMRFKILGIDFIILLRCLLGFHMYTVILFPVFSACPLVFFFFWGGVETYYSASGLEKHPLWSRQVMLYLNHKLRQASNSPGQIRCDSCLSNGHPGIYVFFGLIIIHVLTPRIKLKVIQEKFILRISFFLLLSSYSF